MKGFLSSKDRIKTSFVVRSAGRNSVNVCRQTDLKKCWNEAVDAGGYTVLSQMSGRVYAVSYGRRNTGSIHEGNITEEGVAHYLSIEYLGIEPSRTYTSHFGIPAHAQRSLFDRLLNRQPLPPLFSHLAQIEAQVISEMKMLARYCKEKLEIQ